MISEISRASKAASPFGGFVESLARPGSDVSQGTRPRNAGKRARPRRRGDRVTGLLLHLLLHLLTAGFGTKQTCPSRRSMSAFGGEADVLAWLTRCRH